MSGGVKKWFMLQMWRIQQVAQIITIVLLSFNLAVLIQPWMEWRGALFENKYTAVIFIMLVLFGSIWIFALVWDMRLRMWREQQAVLVERNPYAKEKMTSKELALYGFFWLPMMEKLAKDDPEVQKSVVLMRNWLMQAYKDDASLASEVEHIFDYVGKDKSELKALDRK